MQCPKCGDENRPDAKFCRKCGNNLEEQQKAYFQEQERLAQEQRKEQERLAQERKKEQERLAQERKKEEERIAEARRKRFELWRGRFWGTAQRKIWTTVTCSVIVLMIAAVALLRYVQGPAPVDVVKWIYNSKPSIIRVINDDAKASKYLSQSLLSLLQKEYACVSKTHEMCSLGSDPWTGSQDLPPIASLSFRVVQTSAMEAVVEMRFGYIYSDGTVYTQVTRVVLTRESSLQHWMLDDIQVDQNHPERSLKHQLEAFGRAFPKLYE